MQPILILSPLLGSRERRGDVAFPPTCGPREGRGEAANSNFVPIKPPKTKVPPTIPPPPCCNIFCPYICTSK